MEQEPLTFDTNGILASQQNRYPLLFVDKIIEAAPGKSAVGIKNFTYNEWFFPAHYEDDPNVPGFIQIECLVQTFIMTFLSKPEFKGSKTNFLDMDEVRFRKKLVPGDTLRIEATLESFRRGIAKGKAIGTVDGEFAVSARFTVSVPSVFEQFIPKSE
ncbi:Beta-hydroxyacyl-(acyl-carrier-protein) dehydratase FabA/FabZ [Vibrio sinaloensis DSM 21326]|uniref:Beta-hydroxyacyl-(Acyl-carrier-protein) dehydratase FabA/FabZ n=1 Tax=Vibrio sinaloensis DSM 21326 TaxID=945550 RepID=E8M575_PHOS4|nr:3-hydroxyacyl-ACP dehydratase FabZ [Vibrio sinaloensis]EGA70926.1 Beta-hydroxyacyl-(acyl-carrier-protein) dehydratase FabA/FabZ [Vibrio sinaloensis DSM 21326]